MANKEFPYTVLTVLPLTLFGISDICQQNVEG